MEGSHKGCERANVPEGTLTCSLSCSAEALGEAATLGVDSAPEGGVWGSTDFDVLLPRAPPPSRPSLGNVEPFSSGGEAE